MIKVAIVDDEPLAREILSTYIKDSKGLQLVAECRNALEAFEKINTTKIDLMFLDINMPGISGMDFLKSLLNPPKIIFTTAYPEYAAESYDLNAVDYLLKPVSFDRFSKAVAKVIQVPSIPLPISADPEFTVRTDGRWVKIDPLQLSLVEGLKDYVRLWVNEKRITVHSTMKNMEMQLESYGYFKRIHKSYIVNTRLIDEVGPSELKINGQLVPVGSTYREELFLIQSEFGRNSLSNL